MLSDAPAKTRSPEISTSTVPVPKFSEVLSVVSNTSDHVPPERSKIQIRTSSMKPPPPTTRESPSIATDSPKPSALGPVAVPV